MTRLFDIFAPVIKLMYMTVPTIDTIVAWHLHFSSTRREFEDRHPIFRLERADEIEAARADRELPAPDIAERDVLNRYHAVGRSSASDVVAGELALFGGMPGLGTMLRWLADNNGRRDALQSCYRKYLEGPADSDGPELREEIANVMADPGARADIEAALADLEAHPPRKGGWLKDITTSKERRRDRPTLDFAELLRLLPDILCFEHKTRSDRRFEERMGQHISSFMRVVGVYFSLCQRAEERKEPRLDPEAFAADLPKIAAAFNQRWMSAEFLNGDDAPFLTVPGYLVALWHDLEPEQPEGWEARRVVVKNEFDFWMRLCREAKRIEERSVKQADKIAAALERGDNQESHRYFDLGNGRRGALIEPDSDRILRNLWGLLPKDVEVVVARAKLSGSDGHQLLIQPRKKEGRAIDLKPLYEALVKREGELLEMENAILRRQGRPLKENTAWHFDERQGDMIFNGSWKIRDVAQTAISIEEILELVVCYVLVPPQAA